MCIRCGFVDVTHTQRVTVTATSTTTATSSTFSAKRKRLANAVRASTQSLLPSKIKCENVQIRFCIAVDAKTPTTVNRQPTHTHTCTHL